MRILHTEDIQYFAFRKITDNFCFGERNGFHFIKLHIGIVKTRDIQRVLCRPDDLVGDIVKMIVDVLCLICDAAYHVKAFCAKLGMSVENQTAALSARIAVLIVNPDAEVMCLHGIEQNGEFFQILFGGGKAAGKRDIGDGTPVAILAVGFHVCVVVSHPMMGHRKNTVLQCRGLECFQVFHKIVPF